VRFDVLMAGNIKITVICDVLIDINITGELAAFMFRVKDNGIRFLQNNYCLPKYTAAHPIRLQS
jgi:hypothetical protein